MIPLSLITTLAPLVGKGVVLLMDKIHGRGKPEVNSTKKDGAVDLINTIFRALDDNGRAGLALPGPKELPDFVEQLHTILKQAGRLKGEETVVDILPSVPDESKGSLASLDVLEKTLENDLYTLRRIRGWCANQREGAGKGA